MSGISYDAASYRNLLRMTSHKHLLVEGSDDVRFFKILFDDIFSGKTVPVRIDSADTLIKFGSVLSNREKVEELCHSVAGLPIEKKLVGFVDREFRGFEFQPLLQDLLGSHKVDGRLIWSRGHSVENYFFDFGILRSPMRDLGVSLNFDRALSLYETVFESAVRLACTASLTGVELERISHIRGSLDWTLFDLAPPDVSINLRKWEAKLAKESNQSFAQQVITSFQKWHALVRTAEFDVVRWLCHGHIGFKSVWEVYSRCVYEVCSTGSHKQSHAEAQKSLTASENHRFSSCTSILCQKRKTPEHVFPNEILTLLELNFT